MLHWAGCADAGLAACHTRGHLARRDDAARQRSSPSPTTSRRPLPAAGRKALIERHRDSASRHRRSGSGAILFDSYGGAINRVAPAATAFVHRDQLFSIQYLAYYPRPAGRKADQRWIEAAWRSMRPHVSGMAYQAYIDPALRRLAAGLLRLQLRAADGQVKGQYDPDFRFRFAQAIQPAS